jgi:hypothetical protein
MADRDEIGHGTGIACNLLAVAPRCHFHFYKMDDGINWAPLAGFRAAVTDGMQVISNSWGDWYDPILEAEIATAVANGITVVFAAGNGCPLSWPGSMPEVISVGGAYPIQGGGWQAATYASSGVDPRYPGRRIPDLCGTVGHQPSGILIVMPTMQDSMFDNSFGGGVFPGGDETGADDGYLVASGTSSAAPQVAGAAAVLLQVNSGLTPATVRQTLMNTCIDVTQGQSACGETTWVGFDDATGAGMLDVDAAVDALIPLSPCGVAPFDLCPPNPFECRYGPGIPCEVAPIDSCRRGPFECRIAPYIECMKAPFVECRVAPVIKACRRGPLEGCLAGPWKEPDPRQQIVNPALLRELQVPRVRRMVPVTVMVDELELETWKAIEQAYVEGQIGVRNEFSDFPPTEGQARGPFNPRA